MPDIALCKNETCPLREKCYRYLANPDPYWQAYGDFEHEEEKGCEYFIKEREINGH